MVSSPAGLFLLLNFSIGFVQADSSQEARALIEKLRSGKIEERDSAAKKLQLLGAAAISELKKSAGDSDIEVAARVRLLLRRLEIQEMLTPELRKAFPGVEERLAGGGDHEWTDVFLRASSRSKGFERVYPTLKTVDLEVLASLAILGAQSREEKVRACKAVRFYQLRRAAPEILGLLDDRDPEVRLEAARVVETMTLSEGIPTLQKLLTDPDAKVRATVGPILGGLGVRDAVPGLIKLLEDDESFVRWGAIGALGNLGAVQAVPRITELLKDPPLRLICLRTLSQLGARASIPKILPCLEDEEPQIRAAATRALDELGAKESVPAMCRLLQDPTFFVRCMAVLAIGSLGDREAAPLIAALLDHKVPILRALALEALGKIGDLKHCPRIRRLLEDKNAYVRCQAILALARLGSTESVDALKGLLGDKEKASEGLTEALDHEAVIAEAADFGDLWSVLLSSMGIDREKLTVRFIAGVGLCSLGSTSGIEPFFEVVDEWGRAYNSSALNGLRRPEAWKALRGKVIHKSIQGRADELLGPLGESFGMRIECDLKDLGRVVQADHARWPLWNLTEGASAFAVLEQMLWERGCTVLVEPDRIRVLTRHEAMAEWTAWVKSRGK